MKTLMDVEKHSEIAIKKALFLDQSLSLTINSSSHLVETVFIIFRKECNQHPANLS